MVGMAVAGGGAMPADTVPFAESAGTVYIKIGDKLPQKTEKRRGRVPENQTALLFPNSGIRLPRRGDKDNHSGAVSSAAERPSAY